MQARTLIIGDIHGALKALEQVVERAGVTAADTLIFLGDYVDGWSQSKQVIDYLLELNERHHCIFIRGNHDTWCEDWIRRDLRNATWLEHGGKSTIESYGLYDAATWKRHEAFFDLLHNYYIDAENNLFIHAGFSSMHGPEKEVYASNYSWDRTLWEMALTVDPRIEKNAASYPKRLKLFREIYIGHTPTLGYDRDTPMNAVNVWNVDTGAGFYGKLSAIDHATKTFWQSDPVRELYPDELGRNKY